MMFIPICSSIDPQQLEARARKKRKEEELEYKGNAVIDLDFDDLMTEKEVKSLVSQICFCVSSNYRAKYPMHLHATSLGGKTEQQLQRNNGWTKWKVCMIEWCI